jgi:hypothetical protein
MKDWELRPDVTWILVTGGLEHLRAVHVPLTSGRLVFAADEEARYQAFKARGLAESPPTPAHVHALPELGPRRGCWSRWLLRARAASR